MRLAAALSRTSAALNFATSFAAAVMLAVGLLAALTLWRDPYWVLSLIHILLPKNNGNADPSAGERYGDTAMEVLINDLLKRGAKRSNFEAKVFGGARVLSGATMLAIGDGNITFVNEFLKVEGIPVVSRDVGGTRSRRIHYQPSTGRAWVQHVQPTARDSGHEQEIAYLNRLKTQPVAGEVEVW